MSKLPPRLTVTVVVLTVLAPALGSASVGSAAGASLQADQGDDPDADSRDDLDSVGASGGTDAGEPAGSAARAERAVAATRADRPRPASAARAPHVTRSPAATAGGALDDDPITVEYLVELTPGEPDSVRVTARFAVPRRVTRFVATLPEGASVVDAYGFAGGDGPRQFEMDGSTAEPTITYEVDPRTSHDLFGGLESTDEGSWAFVTTESVGLERWQYRWNEGSNPGLKASMSVADDGLGGTSMAYLGEARVTERRADGQSIRLVVPEDAAVDDDAAHRTLDDASILLQVDDRDPRVTVFVTRDPMRDGGRHVYNGEMTRRTTAAEEDVWVHESASPTGDANVWVHEYVHTRQAYVPSERMAWLDEGIANYYERLVPLYRGDADFETFHRGVATDRQAGDVLLGRDPGVAQYTKGRRVVAALDAKIRAATDGERTFQGVFTRLNGHDGEITYRVFADVVADVAGTSLDGWLDRYVAGDEAPPVPDDPARFAPPEDLDPGGDVVDYPEYDTGTDAPTESPTDTESPSDAESPTDEPTPTDSPTETESPTDRPTDSPTDTASPTDTESPTDEPTDTESSTAEPTDTDAPAETDPSTTEPPATDPPSTDSPTATDPDDQRDRTDPSAASNRATLEYVLETTRQRGAADPPTPGAAYHPRTTHPVPIPA